MRNWYHHNRFGHGGFGRFGFRHGWGHRRPWIFRQHGFPPGGPDGDDGDDAEPPPPPPPSPPKFPFPLPLPFPSPLGALGLEAEDEGHRWRRWRRRNADDEEMGLNDEPFEPPSKDARHRRGRWIRSNGKLILFGV